MCLLQLRSSLCRTWVALLMSNVVFRCVCLIVCVTLGRAKSLLLAAAYTSYSAADKILRRLTAYEVYGGLRRLTAAARSSTSISDFGKPYRAKIWLFLRTSPSLKRAWRRNGLVCRHTLNKRQCSTVRTKILSKGRAYVKIGQGAVRKTLCTEMYKKLLFYSFHVF